MIAVSGNKALKQITGYCIFFVLIFVTATTFAQTKGKLEVIKDPRVDTLAARRLAPPKPGTVASGATIASGYRVQIFTGPSRQEAFSQQNKFLSRYPDIRTYVTYREPNFKVRVGDFKTRMEAEKMMQDLHYLFTGMFIISERINLPKLDITTTTTNE
jgi:hypothetical protein